MWSAMCGHWSVSCGERHTLPTVCHWLLSPCIADTKDAVLVSECSYLDTLYELNVYMFLISWWDNSQEFIELAWANELLRLVHPHSSKPCIVFTSTFFLCAFLCPSIPLSPVGGVPQQLPHCPLHCGMTERCTRLHCTALHCTALHCSAPHRTALLPLRCLFIPG